MAQRPDDQNQTRRIVIVEDRVAYLLEVLRRAPTTSAQGTPLHLEALIHQEACRKSEEFWRGVDLLILDACDNSSQQADATLSRLASLDVLASIEAFAIDLDVVVYSTAMRQPEIAVALHGTPDVVAFYEHDELLAELPAVLNGEYKPITPPSEADYTDLGVGQATRIRDAITLIQSRPDAWAVIVDARPKHDRNTRDWIRKNVLPLLDIRDPTPKWSDAVAIIKRVTGLPVR